MTDSIWKSGNPGPAQADYNNAANWDSFIVPNGTAYFTQVIEYATQPIVTASTTVGQWFVANNVYLFTIATAVPLTLNGAGLTGYMGIANLGAIWFRNSATAGLSVITTSSSTFYHPVVEFYDTSNAGTAQITNTSANGLLAFHDGASARQATITNTAGGVIFYDHSTAETASITNHDLLKFNENSTADHATIVNDDQAFFDGSSKAGSATITNNSELTFGGNSSAENATFINTALMGFVGHASAGNAIITARDEAVIFFTGESTGGSAQLIIEAGSAAAFQDGNKSVGSISGAGALVFQDVVLTIGALNLSSSIGLLTGESGSLVKVGTGTLTLPGANDYSGSTTINAGTLQVDGSIATGATVNSGGTLAGRGTIAGAVTVNAGGALSPGASPGTLTVGGLSLAPGAIMVAQIGGALSGQFGAVIVNGAVSLNGATLNAALTGGFTPSTTGSQALELISNDGTDAVSGHFAGLSEGTLFAIGNRMFTISYAGGSGNDVILGSQGTLITGTSGKDTVSTNKTPAGQPFATGLSDKIVGLGGNDKLGGAAGNDILQGGAGKDAMDGGRGTDTADYSDKAKSVAVRLDGSSNVTVKIGTKAEDTIKNFENVTGGTKGDKLGGDSKANAFDGGLGKDHLSGGGGKDKFVFSTALSAANVDSITDFKHKQDKIVLDSAIFAAIGNALDASEFYAKDGAKAAHDGDDRIIYDSKSGKLYFDADGEDGVAAVQFATLAGEPELTFKDFAII